jgi:hypothetical protein
MLRLFLSVNLACALPSLDFPDDLESLQLLQLRAERHNNTQAVASEVASESSLDAKCYLVGDVHIEQSFWGGKVNFHKNGVFEIVKSIDERFNVQTYQCPAWAMRTDAGWLQGMAFDIDGSRIVVTLATREEVYNGRYVRNGGRWVHNDDLFEDGRWRKLYINVDGVDYNTEDLPFTIPGTSIEIRKHRKDFEFLIETDGFRAEVLQYCEAHHEAFCYFNTAIYLDRDNVPPAADSNAICTTAQNTNQLADGKPILFSEENLKYICDQCMSGIEDWKGPNRKWTRVGAESEFDKFQCVLPPDPPAPPPAKAVCETNGCSWDHGQELCQSLEVDTALFDDCLFDFCQKCDDSSADDFVDFEEDMHPNPICVQGATECNPADVCSKSVKMNTLTVTQNNLGGVGPDEGAEEIRYGNAAVVNGRAVDLVLTTDGTFTTSKPKKNGKSGAFGIINVKCGTAVTVKMQVVDSESGNPVTLERVALTWYDLDEGKKGKGRAMVQTCGSTGAIVSDNTELTVDRKGECSTATSSVAGTGKDNPKSPHQLDHIQISRSLTLPFLGVSEWRSTLSLAKGFKGRNFMFAIEPSVACGAED